MNTEDLVQQLRTAGCVYAEEEAAILLEHAAGDPVVLRQALRARLAGQPLETVVGWAEFAGHRVLVRPGVFVPRRRTELLARLAGADLRPGARVVELCCGTGAVGLTLLHAVPGLDLWASDLDPVAVACARTNLAGLPAEKVLTGDLYDALPAALLGSVHRIVANAPYVPTGSMTLLPIEAREHEPQRCLDGGPDGLVLHRRLAAQASRWLGPEGQLLIESSAEQALGTASAMQDYGLSVQVHHDRRVAGTVVIGRLQGAA